MEGYKRLNGTDAWNVVKYKVYYYYYYDPTLFLMCTSAFAFTSSLTHWEKPCQDTSCSAVVPSSNRYRTQPHKLRMRIWFFLYLCDSVQTCAVCPPLTLSCRSTAQPPLIRAATASLFPTMAARCRAVWWHRPCHGGEGTWTSVCSLITADTHTLLCNYNISCNSTFLHTFRWMTPIKGLYIGISQF